MTGSAGSKYGIINARFPLTSDNIFLAILFAHWMMQTEVRDWVIVLRWPIVILVAIILFHKELRQILTAIGQILMALGHTLVALREIVAWRLKLVFGNKTTRLGRHSKNN